MGDEMLFIIVTMEINNYSIKHTYCGHIAVYFFVKVIPMLTSCQKLFTRFKAYKNNVVIWRFLNEWQML
jgi:hypothetical protein